MKHRRLLSLILLLALCAAALAPLALSFQPASAAPLHSLNDGLVAYWKMDETTGNRLDSAASHTLGAHHEGGSTSGKVGNAVEFHGGTSDYLDTSVGVGVGGDLNPGDTNFTISAWVLLNSTSGVQVIASKWSSSSERAYALYYDTNRFRFMVSPDGDDPSYAAIANSFGAPSAGVWYLVTAWHDATNNQLGIAINDGPADTVSYSLGINGSDSVPFRISAIGVPGLSGFFDGNIDEVGVWSKVLTELDRTDFYNNGSGCTYPFSSCGTPATGGNFLGDGNMEQYPVSGYWFTTETKEFGRLTNNSFWDTILNGRASCGNGWQAIGVKRTLWPFGTPDYYSNIEQGIVWQNGRMVIRWNSRATVDSGGNTALDVYLISADFTPVLIPIVTNYVIPNSPTWATTSIDLGIVPGGLYKIVFDRGTAAPAAQDDTIYIDDVVLSDQLGASACAAAPTATPTITKTPTKTPTANLTASPTATYTPTPAAVLLANCGFESGRSGWTFNALSYVALSGGQVGPQYAVARSTFGSPPDVYQNFYWSGGMLYIKIFALGSPWVQVQNIAIGGAAIDLILQTGTGWAQYATLRYLPPGTYRLMLNGIPSGTGYDGISLSANGYASAQCSTPPTPGPTSFVTASPTPTGLPSATAVPSSTTIPSRTPASTWTPQPTYTPLPTYTPNEPEMTATAGGATVTPPPFPPTSTPLPPPPQQPEPSYTADCVRPQNGFDIAGYIEYQACYALSWITWSNENTQQIEDFQATAQAKEPFGTIDETRRAWSSLSALWTTYNWTQTGSPGFTDNASVDSFTQTAHGILVGDFSLTGPTNNNWTSCNTNLQSAFSGPSFQIVEILGPALSVGICVLYSLLRSLGILAWVQLFFDLTMLLLLWRYIREAWIAKATEG